MGGAPGEPSGCVTSHSRAEPGAPPRSPDTRARDARRSDRPDVADADAHQLGDLLRDLASIAAGDPARDDDVELAVRQLRRAREELPAAGEVLEGERALRRHDVEEDRPRRLTEQARAVV